MPELIFIAIALPFVPHMIYGPQATLIAECFTPKDAISSSSIGYQLSSVISGGPAPLIATALLTLAGLAMRSPLTYCSAPSSDYTNQDISQEHDKP